MNQGSVVEYNRSSMVKLSFPLFGGGCALDKGLAMVSTNLLLVLVDSLNCTTSKDSIITDVVC